MTDSTCKVEEGKLYRLTKTITVYSFPTRTIIPTGTIVMVLCVPLPSRRIIKFLVGEREYAFDLFDLKPLNEILEEVDTTPDISLSFSV